MSAFPETRFVRSGDVDIGYQVLGHGDIDVVFVPGWISNWEVAWELPESARFLERFARYSRLILFDKRGTGLSDRVNGLPTLEEHVDDLRAVLDAVGSTRAALTGWADGAAVALLFAALYPERVSALVVGSVIAKGRGDGTAVPLAIDPDVMDQWAAAIESSWGQGTFLPMLAPSVAGDARFASWWRRLERSSVTPNAAARFFRSMLELDVTSLLPTIHVPTLVIHRRDAPLISADAARWFAEQIPGARYLEVPGADAVPYVGEVDVVLDEVEEFLTGARQPSAADRVLATILFVDKIGRAHV
jgi:pimeloyl-ACP methyl ester carboxylesterase